MKLAFKILGGVALVVAIVVGVVLWRTMQFGPQTDAQAAITLPEPPAVDVAAAAEMLGAAIRIQTVTTAAGDPKPGVALSPEDRGWTAAPTPRRFSGAATARRGPPARRTQ